MEEEASVGDPEQAKKRIESIEAFSVLEVTEAAENLTRAILANGVTPIRRYFSMALLNRLTFTEKDALSDMVPEIINALPHDADYEPEPDRTGESLQSWEALRSFETRKSLPTPGGGEQLRQQIGFFQHNQLLVPPWILT